MVPKIIKVKKVDFSFQYLYNNYFVHFSSKRAVGPCPRSKVNCLLKKKKKKFWLIWVWIDAILIILYQLFVRYCGHLDTEVLKKIETQSCPFKHPLKLLAEVHSSPVISGHVFLPVMPHQIYIPRVGGPPWAAWSPLHSSH